MSKVRYNNLNFAICSLLFALLYAILKIKEKLMPQAQTMTLDEKLAISNKACSFLDAGDREGYNRLMNLIPMPPY